jgi:hypothetical protein
MQKILFSFLYTFLFAAAGMLVTAFGGTLLLLHWLTVIIMNKKDAFSHEEELA